MSKPPHPGRTAAERRVLDQIGCGDFTPRMSNKTRDGLLESGLIIHAGNKILGHDALGVISIPEYSMPIPIHMRWCDAMAASTSEED